jgi:hypothetical protein
MTVGHALQDVSEPGKGLDVVELCGGDEGADGCPSGAAAVRAREQMVFAPERDGPDGALDRIVVELDAAVIEESGEGWPARERITNGLGEGPAGGTRPSFISSQGFIISMNGRALVLRTCRRASAVRPWIDLSVA